jgi:hypothetical protein
MTNQTEAKILSELVSIKSDIVWLTYVVEKLDKKIDQLLEQQSTVEQQPPQPTWVSDPNEIPPGFTRIDL